MNKFLFLIAFLGIVSFSCKSPEPAEKPLAVIFDTDVGNDIDDVLALQMLFNYEKQGKVNLLGITISKSYPRVIDYVDGYANLNNRAGIPLGYAYNGVLPEPYVYVPVTLDTLIEGKKVIFPKRSIADSLPEGYKLQRKLLAAQPDQSVVLIVVGPETNIGRLLQSTADEFSPLSGVELVKKKVKLVSIMGGLYTNEFDFPEWNIAQDVAAAKIVFETCPVPIVASGFEIGDKYRYPATSILEDFKDGYKHPLVVSYKVYQPMPYDRQTWDLTSVLYAVEPEANDFKLSAPGTIRVDEKGNTIHTPDAAGNGLHRVMVYDSTRTDVLSRLVERVTGGEGGRP